MCTNWWHTASHYFWTKRKIITPSVQYGPLLTCKKLWTTHFMPGSSLVFLQAWNRSFWISEFFFIIEEAPGACLNQRVREVDGWHLKHPTNYKNSSTTDYTRNIRFGAKGDLVGFLSKFDWHFIKIDPYFIRIWWPKLWILECDNMKTVWFWFNSNYSLVYIFQADEEHSKDEEEDVWWACNGPWRLSVVDVHWEKL